MGLQRVDEIINMSQSNKEIVRELVDAVTAGDADGILKNLANDLTWTFFGSHRFAGTLNGKEELMAGLFAVVAEVLEDGIKVTVKSMIADEDYVVVEGKGKAGLDPLRWTPHVHRGRSSRCQRKRFDMRRSSGAKWWN